MSGERASATGARLRRGGTALLAIFLVCRSTCAGAQPPTNPAAFGRGNDWVALFGLLFFSCPVVWVVLTKLGGHLRDKTFDPFWERVWGDYFVLGGSLAWIVAVILFWIM
jgi:hypothetical protein